MDFSVFKSSLKPYSMWQKLEEIINIFFLIHIVTNIQTTHELLIFTWSKPEIHSTYSTKKAV